MTEPSNISHLLSAVDVFCDQLPADLPPEVVEETRLVGKAEMTRLFTSMVTRRYDANICGYSVRDQKTFGKITMDKGATYSSQDVVRFIELVYEKHKDIILHAVVSSMYAYVLSCAVSSSEKKVYTFKYENGVFEDKITTISPKVESVSQDFVDALLDPKQSALVHLVSISDDRYIAPDGRIVRVVEDTASVWGGDQGSLFDDAPVVTPSAPTVEGDMTQQFISNMAEKHGDTYGPATVEAVGNDIAAGNAVIEICHNPKDEGGLQYIISGRVHKGE